LSFKSDAIDVADFIESTQIYVISFLSSSIHKNCCHNENDYAIFVVCCLQYSLLCSE